MSIEWRDWCRLCANSEGSGINIFNTAEIVWPDRIIKYLSISVNDEDNLPKQVCQSCCQRLTMFDHYAEQCLKVQEMYRSMSQRDNETEVKAGSIRQEFLQENDTKSQDALSEDTKKGIELLAIEADPFIPSDGSSSAMRKHCSKPTRKKRSTRKKSPVKPRKVPKTIISKIKIEDPERRSSRLQGIARMQMDYGIIDNDPEVKSESDNFIEIEKSVPKKRGRPPKRLVGAAKRKAKKPRVMKPKKTPSDEEFDDLGVEIKSETDTGTGPPQTQSIFRWECHICGETARNWNSLSLHTRREHQVPAQVLCLCAKVLSSRASIIKHRLKHTDGYKYKCEKCDKSFHRRGCYELHVLSHVPKEEQPFVCCKCARRFHCEALLRQHEKVHLPREERLIYPCTTCQKKFSSKSAVSAHIKSIHFGERPFVCDQCGHSFTSKGILQEHLTIHSDETPFKCQHCNKSFKTKYRLKIHLDIHRETPYQCPMCPLQLSTRRTLRMHLVVHKDTKAFQCSTCGKAFRRAKDLKNHHNLHTGRRPYTCTFCPRTFANGSNCRSHKRRMHPEELRIYEAQLAAAENAANNPGSANQVLVAPPNTTPTPQPQDPLQDPLKSSPLSHAHSLSHSPEASQPLSSPISNQTMAPNTQDFQSQVIFDTTASMKNLLGSHVSRALTNSTITNTTMANTSNFQTHNGDNLASRNLSMNNGSHTHNNLMSNLPVHRNAQPASSRNGHFGAGVAEATSDCSVNRSSMGNPRRMHTSSEGILTSHIPNLTPLNLNISELHSNRHQMSSNLGMGDSDRRLDNFHSQRTQIPSLNQGHIPNLTSNLHQLRQHQNFGLSRGINDRIANLNRPDREMSTLNRSGNDRDLGNSNLNQMHHNSEHPNLLQGYTTSLNHLYQHPNSVAAAMAHSGTVGVPAFPGNPYVHHSMGSSLTNYQRGNGNM